MFKEWIWYYLRKGGYWRQGACTCMHLQTQRSWKFECSWVSQRRRGDNNNVIWQLLNGGALGAERIIVQKRCFLGKRHANIILKLQVLLSEICCHFAGSQFFVVHDSYGQSSALPQHFSRWFHMLCSFYQHQANVVGRGGGRAVS